MVTSLGISFIPKKMGYKGDEEVHFESIFMLLFFLDIYVPILGE